MTEPNDSQPDSIESQLQKINLETAMAQLQKLNLEIEDLRAERNWEERIARFIPIITAVISIAGFLWGVVLFRNQQERDRITREADQISRDMNQYRTSYEQLLQFSSNQNMSVARVLSLRQDLDALIDSCTGEYRSSAFELAVNLGDLGSPLRVVLVGRVETRASLVANVGGV